MEKTAENNPETFTDTLRTRFKNIAVPIAAFLLRLGLKPNTVTLFGLIGHFVAGYFIIRGMLSIGGLVVLFMAPFDFLDGTMARLRGESTKLGAFIDSITDRYSEFVLFGSLLLFYLQQQDWLACVLVYLAITGSVMVSYIRSKAEGLQFEAKIGLLSRVERYIVLVPGLIFGYPILSIWIIAILANFTALQRVYHVRNQAVHEHQKD